MKMAFNSGFRCISLFRLYPRALSLRYLVRNCSRSVSQALQAVPTASGTPLTVHGWVRAVRVHKEVIFMHINDGSSLEHLQIVASVSDFPAGATYGSCVKVTGDLVKSSQPKQAVEMKASSVQVLGECNFKNYPFKAHKYHTLDYVRQFPHLRPRTMMFGSLLRVRNAATIAIHKYFQNEGFCVVHSAILTSNDCEGAGEVFRVEPADAKVLLDLEKEEGAGIVDHFFGLPTFLTVSGQLHLEVVSGAFGKVYTFGPTFRAENSRTRHHLSEFSMIEAEIAFTQSLDDIMRVVEGLLKFSTEEVLSRCADDVDHIRRQSGDDKKLVPIEKLLSKPFIRLTYSEAIDILSQHSDKFQNKISWGIDLYKEHERFLVDHCGNGVPVFVTDYPTGIKPFYARKNDDDRTVAAVDLLASGVGEICGGSLREERLDELERRISSANVQGNLDWYLDLRRFGSAPHGGFGIGFERYIQSLLGIQNIRDTLPFPRTANSCRL